jgi:DNA-binding beta-propeller fold protein YncE
MVSIVDLLSGSLAGTLPVSGSIHDAVVAGAMLYAVDTENSRLLAIDTRTRALVGSLALPPRPRFLTLRSTGDELLVLSWGSADDTTTTSPRAPRLSFIRLTPLELLGSIPVYSSATDSARTHVTGIVATAEDFAYVATSAGLVRVDVRSRGSARVLQRWNIRQLLYVPYRGEFWIVTTDTPPRLIVAAGSRAEELFSAPLPEGTIAILPLP